MTVSVFLLALEHENSCGVWSTGVHCSVDSQLVEESGVVHGSFLPPCESLRGLGQLQGKSHITSLQCEARVAQEKFHVGCPASLAADGALRNNNGSLCGVSVTTHQERGGEVEVNRDRSRCQGIRRDRNGPLPKCRCRREVALMKLCNTEG